MSLAQPANAEGLRNSAVSSSAGISLVAVHAVGDDPYALRTATKLRDAASINADRRFEIVASPEEADLTLVIAAPCSDPLYRYVERDPVHRRNRDRAVLYTEMDAPIPLLPGIYPGLAGNEVEPDWAICGPYFDKMRPSTLPDDGIDQPIRWLYSFVGTVRTHPMRQRLMELNDSRSRLIDVSQLKRPIAAGPNPTGPWTRHRQREYDETLAQSHFVLCPRGVSQASIRFFECLRAGRAPVVISDGWVLPPGPDWNDFVLRVPEREIASLPEWLREHERDAARRGAAARLVWERWYGPDRVFASLAQSGLAIVKSTRRPSLLRKMRLLSKPHHAQRLSRYYAKSLRRLIAGHAAKL